LWALLEIFDRWLLRGLDQGAVRCGDALSIKAAGLVKNNKPTDPKNDTLSDTGAF
jgi:hypothetical protein